MAPEAPSPSLTSPPKTRAGMLWPQPADSALTPPPVSQQGSLCIVPGQSVLPPIILAQIAPFLGMPPVIFYQLDFALPVFQDPGQVLPLPKNSPEGSSSHRPRFCGERGSYSLYHIVQHCFMYVLVLSDGYSCFTNDVAALLLWDPWILFLLGWVRVDGINMCWLFFFFFLFLKCIYLTVLGLTLSMQDLHCVMWDFSLQCTDSLVVILGLSS